MRSVPNQQVINRDAQFEVYRYSDSYAVLSWQILQVHVHIYSYKNGFRVRTLWQFKLQSRPQIFIPLAHKTLATSKTIHKILSGWPYIWKFAILLDWKIQLIHLTKAIWALKRQIYAVQYRYLIRNCWNYLKFCGVIQLYAQCIHKTTCLYARKVVRFSRFQRFVELVERTSGNEIV
jgi:hypothetical protein